MFMNLLLMFTIVPVLELYILVKAGQSIGTINTIGIVVVTGILGASLAKSQGAQAISKIRRALGEGQMPGDELLQGALILAGGIMLLTPGFVTDLAGFSLLIPLTRKFLGAKILDHFKKKIQKGQWQYTAQSNSNATNFNVYQQPDHEEDVIIQHPEIEDK
ncbi:MAG: membrane protein FxsA [bacterium]|nr:membrane protein FxsA [bacterium]